MIMNMRMMLVVFFVTSLSLFSLGKEETFKKLKSEFDTAKTINIIAFSETSGDTLDIVISEGNKYQIRTTARILTSDGDTLWNYSVEDSNVIISNIDEYLTETSIENIFFEKLNSLKPYKMSSGIDSRLGSYNKLELRSENEEENIVVYLDKKNNIVALKIINNLSDELWNILKFKTSKNEREYRFRIPNGIEVIDLR